MATNCQETAQAGLREQEYWRFYVLRRLIEIENLGQTVDTLVAEYERARSNRDDDLVDIILRLNFLSIDLAHLSTITNHATGIDRAQGRETAQRFEVVFLII